MIRTDLSTLTIHKLTQRQYNRELEAGNLDENALYLTPDDSVMSVENGGTGLDMITAGNFLVGNGTESMREMTPAEVQSLVHGGTMSREFFVNLSTEFTDTYPTTSNMAKIYTVAVLQDRYNHIYKTFTFDWKAVKDLGQMREYVYAGGNTWLYYVKATCDNNGLITFTVVSNEGLQYGLAYICGYY